MTIFLLFQLSLWAALSPTKFWPKSTCGPTPASTRSASSCWTRSWTRRLPPATWTLWESNWPSCPKTNQSTLASLQTDLTSLITTVIKKNTSISCCPSAAPIISKLYFFLRKSPPFFYYWLLSTTTIKTKNITDLILKALVKICPSSSAILDLFLLILK